MRASWKSQIAQFKAEYTISYLPVFAAFFVSGLAGLNPPLYRMVWPLLLWAIASLRPIDPMTSVRYPVFNAKWDLRIIRAWRITANLICALILLAATHSAFQGIKVWKFLP